ncbi:MAG: hypothetical protein V1850_05160 [Candidatus Bathyarchaeota archaeon]
MPFKIKYLAIKKRLVMFAMSSGFATTHRYMTETQVVTPRA